ncbi:hypothetical protein V6N13_034978 [Hibiscus sabdariffa]
MKRKLSIYQYGSQLDPSNPTRYSPSDWLEISISESAPSSESCSIGAPQVSNSSISDDSELLWRTKDEIQSIPPFKWFSLLLVPVPNSSPGSSQCLALSILRGCNINKFAHDQVPVIVIRLPEPRGLSVETFTNNRRFLMVFSLFTAALSTPPDIWCQIVARFLISLIIELAIFVASIVQVREEGWTSGMRESGSIDKKD